MWLLLAALACQLATNCAAFQITLQGRFWLRQSRVSSVARSHAALAVPRAKDGVAVVMDANSERNAKYEKAMELARMARSGKTSEATKPTGTESSGASTEQTTSGIGGSWSQDQAQTDTTHQPKVGSWGVFERPADISKAYGGGRKVGVGGYQPPAEEEEEKHRRTMKMLEAYRKSVGVDRELENAHKDEIKEALQLHNDLMGRQRINQAVETLEAITQWTNFKTTLGGEVYLSLALAYEAQGERAKAKKIYSRLQGNDDPNINAKAKQLLFGFEAMEFMRVNTTFSEKDRKVMSFKLPDVDRFTEEGKRYDMSYYDPSIKRRRTRDSGLQVPGRSALSGTGSDGTAVQAMDGVREKVEETDVVVVGSGVAGLSCAAILARYGYKVTVLESHNHAGGAAHSFEIKGKSGIFKFDSGPSLYSGLSVEDEDMTVNSRCVNPLKQVLDAVGEKVECINYNTWGVCLPEGDFPATVGAEPFAQDLLRLFPGAEGEAAVEEWRGLQEYMTPLAAASIAVPPAAIRFDLGLVATLLKFLPRMLKYPNVPLLLGPYSRVLDNLDIKSKFIRNWLDMLCFLLSGLPADGTITAEVAFMFAEWYRPGVLLDYPKGGSEGIINALVRGIEKNSGEVRLGQHVEQIEVVNGEATGVRLRGGGRVRARKAVVSNASLKSTLRLLPPDALPDAWYQQQDDEKECPSFMHLHLGFSAKDLQAAMGGKELECHYMVVNDWDRGVDAEQNLVLISIPSVLDPSLAPDGLPCPPSAPPAPSPPPPPSELPPRPRHTSPNGSKSLAVALKPRGCGGRQGCTRCTRTRPRQSRTTSGRASTARGRSTRGSRRNARKCSGARWSA